jgi:hypothetical protein
MLLEMLQLYLFTMMLTMNAELTVKLVRSFLRIVTENSDASPPATEQIPIVKHSSLQTAEVTQSVSLIVPKPTRISVMPLLSSISFTMILIWNVELTVKLEKFCSRTTMGNSDASPLAMEQTLTVKHSSLQTLEVTLSVLLTVPKLTLISLTPLHF